MSLFTEIMNATGDGIEASFAPIEMLGNAPNVLFVVTTFLLIVMWAFIMVKYRKEAAENNTIE
ncbi:MAG: hypothetical protein HRT71_05130 [Flavobacteriales bacterium]|nr:hypothetical protein [Flavobacteriales bacterium]